tara:strand:+ start:22 stop:483 length:462 start_codon:yes stop_codon:yes gene_type:complete
MNIKNKFVGFFIFSSILTLSILNLKNPEKTKFYLFTSKIEEISLGNLITITFISGFTFSTFLGLISKNYSKASFKDNFINDEEINNSDENNFNQELEYKRPPQRDVRESQPTISVNYRFVDQENNSYVSDNSRKTINDLNNEENDWEDYNSEW